MISEYEFPTVGQIAHAQELRGAEVVHVRPEPDGSIPRRAVCRGDRRAHRARLLHDDLVPTGHRHDVAAIAEVAHANGALVLADSYQAAGAIELDVRTLGADFVTGGTVKYLLASAGLGFLWVRGGVLERLLPTQTGWFADEDIFRMDISDYSPHATARRFDAARRRCRTSTRVSPGSGCPGDGRARDRGARRPAQHAPDRGLEELGADRRHPADPARRGPLVCVASTDAPALVASLAEEQITCSLRDTNLRIAAHLYNTDADIDTLLEASAPAAGPRVKWRKECRRRRFFPQVGTFQPLSGFRPFWLGVSSVARRRR